MKTPTQQMFNDWPLNYQQQYIRFCLNETEIAPDLPSWIFHPLSDIAINFVPTPAGDIRDIRCTSYQKGMDDMNIWRAIRVNVN